MRLFKLLALGFAILLNGTLFLSWFSFSNIQTEFIHISLVDFFTEFTVLFKSINNVFIYSMVILLIILFVIFSFSYLFYKKQHYFLKSFMSMLLQFGIIILFYIMLKGSITKLHIGFFMALILMLLEFVALLYFRKNILFDSKVKKEEKMDDKNESFDGASSIEPSTVVETKAMENNNDIITAAMTSSNNDVVAEITPIKNSSDQSPTILHNDKVSIKEYLVFDNVKHLQRILLFINIALFASLFFVWQANVSKDNAITIALSSNLFHLQTKIVFVLFFQMIVSILLYFNDKRIFIVSSLLTFIIYIITVITVTSYINFTALSFSPSIGFMIAIIGVVIIILSYQNMKRKNEYPVNLLTELHMYFKYLWNLFVKLFHNLKYLFIDWKNDK